ncbi:hypothetical protein VitviT2T_002851 [Vitis vinifera]|uniref:Peptidase A1 domain-containing protein n=2 Tax=Vitis vinifera TaxID=29760 RepID=A0ABY9BK38_VITVI|nr:aspartic proteinase CDR1 [Vitis vinifera]RVX02104.1 Aspartic proteinase CDR1 [Vitis vinifera]WJZ83144.1 hypothetical protein VitviT2T_002851 [Vitis vinifera]|eukprot:XP_002266614.1 PREDICTED: aspartic proteinase CDR1-like [Vitis vinifera]
MEGFNLKFVFCTLAIIILIHFSEHSHAEAKIDGFTTDFISRDSPHSPFYNPSETKYQRLQKAFRRSILRGNHFRAMRASPNDIQSDVISGGGAYLMNISLGTPPVPMLGIADTGSDLIWRQCLPCPNCYEQVEPLFDPKESETYKTLDCDNEFCQDLGQQGSCDDDNTCTYSYSYGDRSYTRGDLSSDTLTIGSTEGDPASFPGIAFGCGHDNGGTFNEKDGGLIGLGGGPLSLVMQLSSEVGGQFSYCLVPLSSDSTVSSKINFGKSGVVSGSGTVSTPLIKGTPDTFYYLTLEGLSVGSETVAFKGFSENKSSPAAVEEGNIIIDSGTTLTLLPQDFYTDVESALTNAIGGQTTTDPNGIFSLCYSSVNNLEIPTITAHFTGADVQLPPLNTFVQVQEDLVCFSMIPSSNLAIFGNLAQINFLVGYDLKNNKVSFKQTDCTE